MDFSLNLGTPGTSPGSARAAGRVLEGVSLEFYFAQMGGILTQEVLEEEEGSEDQTAAV